MIIEEDIKQESNKGTIDRIRRFVIAYTPDGEAIFVALDKQEMTAYDFNGYSYQWEDGYITLKSDKPNLQDVKDVMEAYKEMVDFIGLKTKTIYIS